MLSINYVKNKNAHILATLDDISKIQNYVPLYNEFFSLNETNFNSINLNHKWHITEFVKKNSENRYICKVKCKENKKKVPAFFKFSPLLDPVKFLVGKYKKKPISVLPSLEESDCLAKLKNPNNSAYVDSFFYFLTSQAIHTHGFYHGIDFYGSFLAIKDNFHYNIADDIDYLCESNFFHKNKGDKFIIDRSYEELFSCFNTRNYKRRLKLGDSIKKSQNYTTPLDEISLNGVFTEAVPSSNEISNITIECDISNNTHQHNKTTSTKSSDCSSRSSHTSNESEEESLDGEDESEYSGSAHSMSTAPEDIIEAILKKFPVQIICLEALDGTLDSIMEELESEEWRACLFQIIMSLVVYRKLFDLTHNDLHTNNIMYTKTDKTYLCYRYKGSFYKVPTFGRIYKIIDFGRAIYKYKGKRICSDSFHPKGDAATQYNCEPYLNKKKPRLDPNPSFDLCRLGCSLYDFFAPDDEGDGDELPDPITKLVDRWCKDDTGRNILYKSNGDERYPEFKLYKMIVRTVHHCPPEKEIENPIFRKFITSRKKNKRAKVFDVDKLPSYIK